jgi:integral membrane protein
MSQIPFLRRLSLAEGVSFLLLVFIAMPLKYIADQPMAVKVFGWAHGLLFVILCLSLLQVTLEYRWSMKRAAMVFIAALLPFGPFVLDRRMRQWQGEATE